ncbi:hypothetical protein GCM10010096_11480 [Alcaligenes pakistanensis]|uniref:Uncharacterized protein n=1 Tax=Alcaligenes pakistanensis TaxID=1482717 RepID=A0A8H9IGA4_9BURK|nr:hypothetical protein GCM10010096_11480 [Alcaligenes pakistanensis]
MGIKWAHACNQALACPLSFIPTPLLCRQNAHGNAAAAKLKMLAGLGYNWPRFHAIF